MSTPNNNDTIHKIQKWSWLPAFIMGFFMIFIFLGDGLHFAISAARLSFSSLCFAIILTSLAILNKTESETYFLKKRISDLEKQVEQYNHELTTRKEKL